MDLDAWLAEHIVCEQRRAEVRATVDCLGDFRAVSLEALEDELGLASWPALPKRRFLDAWRRLKDGDDSSNSTVALDDDDTGRQTTDFETEEILTPPPLQDLVDAAVNSRPFPSLPQVGTLRVVVAPEPEPEPELAPEPEPEPEPEPVPDRVKINFH